MSLICADIQYLECDTSMGMQTNFYCTSESCCVAFALWCYFSRLYSTNIRTDKITQHTHPPSPPKARYKQNWITRTHKLHNTHTTHTKYVIHTHTHTHTHTHKLSTNCLIHTHKMSVIHTPAHSKTVNCLIHTHTNGLSFTHDTRVCNRLSSYSGYSDIRKSLSVRIAI